MREIRQESGAVMFFGVAGDSQQTTGRLWGFESWELEVVLQQSRPEGCQVQGKVCTLRPAVAPANVHGGNAGFLSGWVTGC